MFVVQINNVPSSPLEKYVVARFEQGALWYWGAYDTKEMADMVALTIKNGLVVEVEAIEADTENVGHWEWVPYGYPSVLGNWVCSECKSVVVECVSKDNKGKIPTYKYCPQCGQPKILEVM